MKKTVSIFLFCFLLIFVLYSQQNNQELPYDLTTRSAWALALPGIIDTINGTSSSELAVDYKSIENKVYWRNFLIPAWNIHNKDDLQNQLQWLLTNGQNQEVNNLIYVLQDNPTINYKLLSEKKLISDRTVNGIVYLQTFQTLPKINFIKAYDLGRYIELSRWGYQAGYLTNKEAWDNINSVINEVLSEFTSWEEFGQGYLYGRLFWLTIINSSAETKKQTINVYNKLLQDRELWSRLPWTINDTNDSEYLLELGKMYYFGHGVGQDKTKGYDLIKKLQIKNLKRQ